MKSSFLSFLTLLLVGGSLSAERAKGDSSLLEDRKERALALCDTLGSSSEDSTRKKIGKKLHRSMKELLECEGVFGASFPKLGERIGIITAPDSSFRLFNWNVAYTAGTHEYFAYILRKKGNGEKVERIRLKGIRGPDDRNKEKGGGLRKRKLERMKLEAGEWIPALYYEIIKKERNGEPIYTLLGWEGKDRYTTRKTIEVLHFTEEGEPRFGLPIFKKKNENEKEEKTWRERERSRRKRAKRNGPAKSPSPKQRIIFEFTNDAVMTLKYEEENDRIVFNQLVPERPDLKGMYEFYGPDLFFNAYVWKADGHWAFEKKIQPKNEGQQRSWNDPEEEE